MRPRAPRLCHSRQMLLYNSAVSGNCYKVRLLVAHLGVPLELHELSVVDRSDRPDVIGDLNPALRVPTLVLDDGRGLPESNAILWYLGDGSEYVPTDRYERAQVLQWQFFEQYQHEPAIAVARFLLAYSGEAEKHADRIAREIRNGYTVLDIMERYLANHTYFVGERYSIADITLYAYTHVAHEGGFDLENYPAIRSWLDRVAGQPGHIAIDA
jgi:glutathione S-transferase